MEVACGVAVSGKEVEVFGWALAHGLATQELAQHKIDNFCYFLAVDIS